MRIKHTRIGGGGKRVINVHVRASYVGDGKMNHKYVYLNSIIAFIVIIPTG